MERIIAFLERQSPAFTIILAMCLMVSIGLLDYVTGNELSISVFYLLPVIMVTWFIPGKTVSWLTSILSATTWLFADVISSRTHSAGLVDYWNALVRFGFFITVAIILAALKQALHKEKELARTDSLTGAANSRLFYEIAQTEIYRAERTKQPLTIAYIDLDNFKQVNDSFGHLTGDLLLCLVVNTIKEIIRLTDTIARLGGDEFCVLLPDTGHDQAVIVVNRLRNALLAAMEINQWQVTFSIGVVTFNHPPSNVDQMIFRADQLMYSVKNGTKNASEYLEV